MLTGQYPHNNGVIDNEPGYGALNAKDSTIYSWLQNAGYRTGHMGRFLLNYDRPAPPDESYETDGGFRAPAGVEHWFGYISGQTKYYGATFSRNGTPVTLGEGPRGYTTRAINDEALEFVRTAKTDGRPFFLNVSHLAPHSSHFTGKGICGAGGLPYPEDGQLGRWRDEPLPKGPAFDEAQIADKPAWIESRPALGAKRRNGLHAGWRCALATLETVDRGVADLVEQLERQGELENTAIFFTSDNGYFFGEHRIFLNKVYPYEEALRVPLLARVPERLLGSQVRRRGRPAEIEIPVNNVDLAATFLDLANAQACTSGGSCRVLDGHSLMPLLRGQSPDWTEGRGLLTQLGGKRECGELPPERGLDTFYDLVRTRRHVYVELNRVNPLTGVCDRPEYELYDLREDPNQLRNRAVDPLKATPSPLQAELAARLEALRSCSGPACG
jgi:arylsulfatase A-like enzyme